MTCVACKILERLFVNSLTSYFDERGLLNSSQNGFCRGKTTVINILECDARIGELINGGKACGLVLIEFRRAFDQIDHAILCKKLKDMEVDGCNLIWVKDCLFDRKQFVVPSGVV